MPTSRTLLVTIALACLAVVGAAVYLQLTKDLLPCPLCVIQRYAYLSVAAACLIGAWRNSIRAGGGVALLAALGGLYTVGDHLWVLAHPGLSCGIDPKETFLNKLPTATYLPSVFRADGLCEDALDTLFGLSIPQWSGITFVAITAALIFVLARRR
ncbi:MAG: disulfide bond formation protein B [Pseudomonadota bacterium]